VGEDKAYGTTDHVARLRVAGITPHADVTQNNKLTKTGRWRTAPSTDEQPDNRLCEVTITSPLTPLSRAHMGAGADLRVPAPGYAASGRHGVTKKATA
jgi:hypothetical protein